MSDVFVDEIAEGTRTFRHGSEFTSHEESFRRESYPFKTLRANAGESGQREAERERRVFYKKRRINFERYV